MVFPSLMGDVNPDQGPLTFSAQGLPPGVPMSLQVTGLDADFDWLNRSVSGLPRGMVVQPGSSNGSLLLNWTPDYLAAQNSNVIGGQAGHYIFTVKASDGAAEAARTFEVTVANTNQAPVIAPMPLQLVNEGQTLGFSILVADPNAEKAPALSWGGALVGNWGSGGTDLPPMVVTVAASRELTQMPELD